MWIYGHHLVASSEAKIGHILIVYNLKFLQVRKIKVAKRNNDIVNRLNKTKEEGKPDFRAEREQRDQSEREDKKRIQREQREKQKEEERQKQEEAELR